MVDHYSIVSDIDILAQLIEDLSNLKCSQIMIADTNDLNNEEICITKHKIKSVDDCISILRQYNDGDCDD